MTHTSVVFLSLSNKALPKLLVASHFSFSLLLQNFLMLMILFHFYSTTTRPHHSQNNLCSNNFYHTLENSRHYHHHRSVDELSCRNYYCVQKQEHWPKSISKSPSSYSMNSNRFNRHLSYNESPRRQKMIEEFDLERIEKERRKSHTNLFEKCHRNDLNLNYGTAV